MSNRIARRRKTRERKARPKVRRKLLLILCSFVGLASAVALMTRWKVLSGTAKPMATVVAPTSDSFAADRPSKEYIYAGDRLIAIEEPAAGPAPQSTGLSAACTARAVRSLVTAGHTYRVAITMRNTGSVAWNDSTIKLGIVSPAVWGVTRVAIPTPSLPVDPGAEVLFDFPVTAPSQTGPYVFQWRMQREDSAGSQFFGDPTAAVEINVTNVQVDTPFDFDGDTRADIVVWRPSEGKWYVLLSGGGVMEQTWGMSGDTVVPADYDGDRKTDLAVWRPGEGNWYIKQSSNGAIIIQGWGMGSYGHVPVPGDYDGDGRDDFAVWSATDSNWYVMKSSGGILIQGWGQPGDVPAPGDYDGDGRYDFAVFRRSQATWYVMKSSGGTMTQAFGLTGDAVAPADYDGDGKTDMTVWRPSNAMWYVMKSGSGGWESQWGQDGDKLVPADYDGDGRVDMAVWRAAGGTWYVMQSSTNTLRQQNFGMAGDIPVSTSYVGMP